MLTYPKFKPERNLKFVFKTPDGKSFSRLQIYDIFTSRNNKDTVLNSVAMLFAKDTCLPSQNLYGPLTNSEEISTQEEEDLNVDELQ